MGKNNRAPTNSAIPNIRGFKQEHQSRDIKIDSENYAKTHRQTSAASASIKSVDQEQIQENMDEIAMHVDGAINGHFPAL